MSRDQLKRLKELEAENIRPRRAVSDLTLDSEAGKRSSESFARRTILAEAARGV